MISWLDKVFDGEILDVNCFSRPFTNSGDRYAEEKILKDIDGVQELVPYGKTDLYEYIQSHKDSVDINKILERYESGDVTVLNKVAAQYLDIADAPKNLAEMYSFIRNTKAFFESLPLEVREKYDFNPAAFVADFGSPEFKKMFTINEDEIKGILPQESIVMEKSKEVPIVSESEVKVDAER